MNNIQNTSSTKIDEPKFEDFSLTYDQFSRLEEELGIYIAELEFKYEMYKTFISKMISIIIISFLIIYGILILIALVVTFINSSFNITEYDNVPYFVLYLFGFTLLAVVVMFILKLIGIEYFKIRMSSINKKSKYSNLHKYNKAFSEYKIYMRLTEEKYWRSLSGRHFEIELANLFRSKGFKVNITKQGGDGGIDLIIKNSKDNYSIGVQCKAHRKKIPPYVARDLLGTIKSFKFEKGFLITLEGGTTGTVDFCKRNDILIWDVNDIIGFRLNENLTVDTFNEYFNV